MSIIPDRLLSEAVPGGHFDGMERMNDTAVQRIIAQYPRISRQYIVFITEIGIGRPIRDRAPYICEPEPIETVTNDSSFLLYQGKPYRGIKSFFGLQPPKPKLPHGALIVSDTGASWRYCFGPELGDKIYCFDNASLEFTVEADDFFSFLAKYIPVD